MRTTFIKRNPLPGRDTLVCEAKGLDLLELALLETGLPSVHVPRRLEVSADRLILEAIPRASPTPQLESALGLALAAVHARKAAYFGLDHDNFIGLNPQPNGSFESWGEFFIERRLGYQISLIMDRTVRDRLGRTLDAVRQDFRCFLNDTCPAPSLLHGDLWGGNILYSEDAAWLIDPAVYYGDSEADLAMTEMFGGFGRRFYEAYQSSRPLTQDYPLKRQIYNCYHYLNHYNLFGSSYLDGCEQGLRAIHEAVYR